MANERDEEQSGENEGGSSGRQPTDQQQNQQPSGQQAQPAETGQQSPQTGGQSATGQAQAGAGSEPPRSMGTRGSEFGQFGDATGPAGQQGQSGTGQADLGTQADTTLAGRSDQQDLATDQPGSVGGASGGGSTGEGFIGGQGQETDEYLQERDRPLSEETGSSSSAKATGGADFADQGRGATDENPNESDSGDGEGNPS